MTKYFMVAIFIALVSGCAGTNPSAAWNEKLIKQKAPTRMVKDTSFTQKNAIRYAEDWAGKKGKSIVNEKYKTIIFSNIQKRCGYGKNEFIETYVIQHTDSDKALRDDKISGLTVYLEYNKKTNQTLGDFFGKCHTGKGTSFTISD